MADLTLTSKNPTTLGVDALVVGTHTTSDGVALVGADLPAPVVDQIETLAELLGVTGAADEVHKLPAGDDLAAGVLVLTGLGTRAEDGTFEPETLRRAAGAAVRALAGTSSVAVALPADDEASVAAVAEGALLGAYAYARYRGSAPKDGAKDGSKDAKAPVPAPPATIEVVTPISRTAKAKAALHRATVLAAAVHGTRDLVNAAPNDLYPAAFADAAKAAAKGTGVKVTVLDEKQLAAGGYGGLVGVGQGSVRGPRLVKVSYSPSKPASKVALVGKGITFDSGGISIKPAAGMDAMKSDMSGAAAVLHTVVAAARLGLPVAVTGWLCLAENMPSGSAQRPSDVVTIRGGKTVEVLNTDAEGRLVMADGLVAATEEKPDVVLDIATLTGAQMVALGNRVSAVMGDDAVRDEVVAAAAATGEQFWPMPLPGELRATLASKVADLANIGERWGGMLIAGVFLREFVGSTPWAHLDIAGPAFNEKAAHGYTPVGGTGVGVRTLLGLVEARATR
ncbi:leucyl aminopeptidase [Sediminihabitans luteus]|uniref:Probable cytosol aminopeptidase n=1 Tax=Sediminihabitans luteus TaxID=1138585 RepID=A0A2M9CQ15_9CELL|nr:leucyl aminopeptidase [Sediminihabitans luteus]PJJ74022.1 leucyl aminopeptidase [Sediminihabitans luteus]GII98063.1 putative cytosol aminopeptidase [Sediminihabitans luteus]